MAMNKGQDLDDMPALCPKCNRAQPKATIGWLRQQGRSGIIMCAYCGPKSLSPGTNIDLNYFAHRWMEHNGVT